MTIAARASVSTSSSRRSDSTRTRATMPPAARQESAPGPSRARRGEHARPDGDHLGGAAAGDVDHQGAREGGLGRHQDVVHGPKAPRRRRPVPSRWRRRPRAGHLEPQAVLGASTAHGAVSRGRRSGRVGHVLGPSGRDPHSAGALSAATRSARRAPSHAAPTGPGLRCVDGGSPPPGRGGAAATEQLLGDTGPASARRDGDRRRTAPVGAAGAAAGGARRRVGGAPSRRRVRSDSARASSTWVGERTIERPLAVARMLHRARGPDHVGLPARPRGRAGPAASIR